MVDSEQTMVNYFQRKNSHFVLLLLELHGNINNNNNDNNTNNNNNIDDKARPQSKT